MKGGNLCGSDYEGNDDKYTLGEIIIDGGVYVDKNDTSKIIKVLQKRNLQEYKILKQLEHTGFTPKVYGLYDCAEHDKIVYLVMEKIPGVDLFEYVPKRQKELKKEGLDVSRETVISNFIDEIYEKYNRLLDMGIIHSDLFLQNIILGENGKIYFIDFEHSIHSSKSVQLSDRLSKEQLLENLVTRKFIHNPNPNNKYVNKMGGGKTNFRKKSRKQRVRCKLSIHCREPSGFSQHQYRRKTQKTG